MNTTIDFVNAKLLKEKGYMLPCSNWYNFAGLLVKFSSIQNVSNDKRFPTYSAPIIADVVMWLYEKHGIWINVSRYFNIDRELFSGNIHTKDNKTKSINDKNTPAEAYIEGISYSLKKFI